MSKIKTISLFKQVMGISPTMKIIEYLLEWEGYDITITDIARGASVNRNNTYIIIENLRKQGIIKMTRTIGTSKFYELNRKNKITKDLSVLFNDILHHNLTKKKGARS